MSSTYVGTGSPLSTNFQAITRAARDTEKEGKKTRVAPLIGSNETRTSLRGVMYALFR